jgi:Xaa-Pro aminopeptidase
MSDAGLDALLVLNEGNMCYLTGYEGFSSYVPQAALVSLEDDPYVILRAADVRCAELTCWLPHDRLIGYAETYVGTADRNPWTAIGEFVKDKVGTSARIGAEFTAQRGSELGFTDHASLVQALGGRELHDGSGLVQKCKRVKSERELAYIMEAAVITDRAMHAAMDKIAVGVRQCDVAATIMSTLIAGTDTIPGGPSEESPWLYVGPAGGFANAPHLKWTDESYVPDQQTNLEFGAFRRRYACVLARTAYLGSPSARLREVSNGVIEAWHAGFDAMQPGRTCSDVARAVGDVLKRHGIRKETRCGYSVGLDWIDGGASLAAHDDTELVPNMTFHLLVGIYERDYGYNFSESVRVTDDGAKSLSDVPRKLFEIPA